MQLDAIPDNYADSFKTDILFFIDDFNEDNQLLYFLKKMTTKSEIINWIDGLTSKIVMKFDKDSETIGDFIFEYM